MHPVRKRNLEVFLACDWLAALAAHIWFSETRTVWDGHGRDGSPSRPKNGVPDGRALPPLLGIHNEAAYHLAYFTLLPLTPTVGVQETPRECRGTA
jgi:hypothetical protein